MLDQTGKKSHGTNGSISVSVIDHKLLLTGNKLYGNKTALKKVGVNKNKILLFYFYSLQENFFPALTRNKIWFTFLNRIFGIP